MSLNAVDIFAGTGGLGEGFHQAGFTILSSIDFDRHSCQTLRTRILYRYLRSVRRIDKYVRYLHGLMSFDVLREEFPDMEQLCDRGVREVELSVKNLVPECNRIGDLLNSNGQQPLDVLIGGPPCQAYSLVGRSRDNHRKLHDERHYLYRVYLKMIGRIKPNMFLYENVPGLITARSVQGDVIRHFIEDFGRLRPSYIILRPPKNQSDLFSTDVLSIDNVQDFILNTSEFGIPQKRKRFIMIGIRKDLWKENQSLFHRLWPRIMERKVKRKVSVHDAIGDLPQVSAGHGSDRFYGRKYALGRPSMYASKMRRSAVGVLNHRARTHMRTDLDRYDYFAREAERRGLNTSLTELAEKRPDLLPDHKNKSTFLDRFKVQLQDQPASTITAHISKDGHYYIHPDPRQNRSLTVREAARLQSFPDSYFFEGPRTEQFRQVGNAVPPLFAQKLAEAIRETLLELE